VKTALALLLLCVTLAIDGCGGSSPSSSTTSTDAESKASQSAEELVGRPRPKIPVPDAPPPRKLVVKDLIDGSGARAEAGDMLTVEYFGIRYTGGIFSNSWDNGEPFEFRLGSNDPAVSPGWEKGLLGMKVGGRREMILPPDLLYHGGAPPDARPDEAVIYVIDLLNAR
jgi:peptidylprolyl isomerase